MIDNLSFIVIARNEAFAVQKCLGSIASMPLADCEVICVDSDSTDTTLDVMKSYGGKIQNLRIVQCSGYVNAAVARNAGMEYATKQHIFFVDGDVELYPEFIAEALDRIQSGKADAVTGKLLEIQYSSDYTREIRRLVRREHMTREKKCLMTGGIFIVTKAMVDAIGEWDSSFWRSQDLDYTLRISRHGTLLQLPQFIGVHHTQEFHDRSWEHYRKGHPLLYGRLLRKSLDSPRLALGVLRRNRGLATFLLMGVAVSFSLAAAALSFWSWRTAILGMAVCLLIDFLYSTVVKHWRIDQWLLHNYLTPPLVLFGVCAKPKPNKESTTAELDP